jgi:hypothetical protein
VISLSLIERATPINSLTDALTDMGYPGYQVAGNVRRVLQHLVRAIATDQVHADQSRVFRLKLD